NYYTAGAAGTSHGQVHLLPSMSKRTKRAVAVAKQRDHVPRAAADHQIVFIVAVDFVNCQADGRTANIVALPNFKIAVPVPEEDFHASVRFQHGQIGVGIAVEFAGGNGDWAAQGLNDLACSWIDEAAALFTQKRADRVGSGLNFNQIDDRVV